MTKVTYIKVPGWQPPPPKKRGARPQDDEALFEEVLYLLNQEPAPSVYAAIKAAAERRWSGAAFHRHWPSTYKKIVRRLNRKNTGA